MVCSKYGTKDQKEVKQNMTTPQEPPAFGKIDQLEDLLNSIINGEYTTEQKDEAQQVLDSAEDYRSKLQTSLDTFSDNVDKQYIYSTSCKSLEISKTTTLVDQLSSAMNALADGAFLDNLISMTVDELVDYLDEHLSDVLDSFTNASNSATTFSSLIEQTNGAFQTVFSNVAFLMSSLNDADNGVRNALNGCVSFLMHNDSSVNSKFTDLDTISEIPDPKGKIDKIKEIANTIFNNETEDISNSALNIIETLS